MVSGVFPVTAGRYFVTLLSSALPMFAGVLAPSSKNDLGRNWQPVTFTLVSIKNISNIAMLATTD